MAYELLTDEQNDRYHESRILEVYLYCAMENAVLAILTASTPSVSSTLTHDKLIVLAIE